MTHTHTHKFTAKQIAEWNKRQIEINFEDYGEKNGIKIKDFIAHLQTLYQEKFIYVEYDSCATFPPIPDAIDTEGDYKIVAG